MLISAPFLLNLIACVVFMLARPPAKTLVEEREHAQKLGVLTVSSSDPYMMIAERPLHQWAEWHGGEAAWVKAVEALDAPALFAAKTLVDRWSTQKAFSRVPNYARESWQRAYIFVAVSSLQWLLVGLIIAKITKRTAGRQ
jgi:hypothetical protein